MARGMSRRGLSVSSPSEAAPSKPRKREEPVDGSQGDGPESDSVRHREGGQGELLSTRGRAAYYPGEDDYDKDHDQGDRETLHGKQSARDYADVPVG